MKRPERIVLFDQYPYLGGGQVLFLTAIKAALDTFDDVCVVIPMGGALERAIRTRFGARVRVRSERLPSLTHGRKSSLDILRLAVSAGRGLLRHTALVWRARVLYGNGPRQFPQMLLWSLLLRKRCCFHIHIDIGSAGWRLLEFAVRFGGKSRIILNSKFIAERLASVAPSLAASDSVVMIENGLDFKYEGREFRNRFSAPGEAWNVLVPGVIRPEKGQDAAVDMASVFPNLRIHIVGRTGEGSEEWAEALRRRAPGSVSFHAPVDDLGEFIQRWNIQFVLVPSRWAEPFGLVAIEGMAESCVTIVSGNGALADIAAETGALSYGSQFKELCDLMGRLVKMGPSRLSSLAMQQFNATMRRYGPDRLGSDLRGVMLSVSGRELQ